MQIIDAQTVEKPNIVIIYADDLGYGDISCYGATKISTPNIDNLARQGLRFTNMHATSATSTPSRYSLLTGKYAWRKKGTGIAAGDASALIQPGQTTLPSLLKKAGYTTAVVGKWHLGLGTAGGTDWNGEIKPGPMDIGFDYNFLIPATGDRVPCVFVENRRVVNLDPKDPIEVSYSHPVGNEPTGKNHPELLKMQLSHGHDQTIINGISRIGYMSGGKAARWVDEDIADIITGKAKKFIEGNKDKPFFLYFSTHDVHVPRVPNARFAGKSGLGPRGDVILQLDNSVKEIMETLKALDLLGKTIVIFSSDNGPVLNDGYKDQAVELQNGHKPAGPFRGGKYSAFDGGTRIPFIVYWSGRVKPGESKALVSQIDFMRSFAMMVGITIPDNEGIDSENNLNVILGKSQKDRDYVIEQNANNTLAILKGNWKYIEPSNADSYNRLVNIELGNNPQPQLYNLKTDLGEKNNVASTTPKIVKELSKLLEEIKGKGFQTQEDFKLK
ncbi:MAG: arylsulfatase [Bacteroidia bacterium]|nr:arylsulfatase [Bacteroidia bacterium]